MIDIVRYAKLKLRGKITLTRTATGFAATHTILDRDTGDPAVEVEEFTQAEFDGILADITRVRKAATDLRDDMLAV